MYERHPLSAAFPSMSAEEQDALTNDIEQHGQRDPITIYQGQVLDGWHRYQACSMLEITCIEQGLADGIDPISFVISMNMHRRHLNQGQLAVAVVACNEWRKVGRPVNNSAPSAGLTTKELANQAGTGTRTIEQAKKAVEAGLADKVRDGELSVKKASEMAKPKPATPPPIITHEPEPQPEMVTIEKEQYEEMKDMLDASLEEEKALADMLDAEPDDRLAAATAQIKQLVEQVRLLKMSLDGANNRNNEYLSMIKTRDRKITKLEKELDAYKIDEVGL